MEINKENDMIQEAFEIEADEIGFCLDQKWGDYENPYENNDTALAYDLFKKGWKAKATPEGFVLVPREPTQDMMIAALAVISTGIGKDHIDVEIIQCWKKMIEAQEQSHD